MRPDNWWETLNCAVEGIIYAVRSQRHMRWHVLTAFLVLILTPLVGPSPVEFALLCLAAALVLVAELINTAVEAAVDLASPQLHPLAGAAKDVAAGGVLVAAFAAVAVGTVVLLPHLEGVVGDGVRMARHTPAVATVAVVLAVLVLTVYLKARTGRGRPLHGGFPSGHAAVAFALAVWLGLHSADAVVVILSLVLALMVSHSRLLHGIHSWVEVVAGAVLGTGVALLLYVLFS